MNLTQNTPVGNTPEFLSGGGEMGKVIRSKDWSKTPLGSPDTWPQSLRTTISLCLASNFPISIAWGPHRVQIYNDGYLPITGDKHPESMGQDFKECWLSAWPVIGESFEEASMGKTSFLENQRIFLERFGYIEETFFTFSFSPILDESGGIGGVFHPVLEQTQQALTERRLNILRTVADLNVAAKTEKQVLAHIMECLKDFELDLPFVLLYSTDSGGKEAKLQGSAGVTIDSPIACEKINLAESNLKSWPFTEILQNGKVGIVEELGKVFGAFDCSPYPECPKQALIFPLTLSGTTHNNYLLVAGVSSRRNLDEKYRLFYELLAEAIKNALAVARAYEEERKKAEALAEIDKAKTVFFSNISHEFRTPLTLMLGSLEELLNKRNGEIALADKEAIQTSHRNAMRLLRLVNNLLDFSRIEAGKVQAQYQLTDLAKYTTEIASNFRSVVESAGLFFEVKTEADIQPVYIDKEMWEKIILNLLSNAFKYTLKGSIKLSLTTENNKVVLKVADTGVGIPEAELPKMFQRFHRVQNVVGRTYEGTGIGLSLVSELVKLHGGEIKVESKEADGSVFTVTIPTGKAHLPSHQVFDKDLDFTASLSDAFINEATTLIDHKIRTVSGEESFEEYINGSTVLVVDDNADMRAYIKNLLQKQYNVITANNGLDALQQVKEHSPQLILSDVMMPVMDGIQLLKAIKENIQTQNIPVILLSARAGEESKIEGYETGADDYLIKPFSAKELLARVASQLKTSTARKQIQRQLQNIITQAPVAMCMFRGPTFIVEVANDRVLELWGKTSQQVINKPIFEGMPDAAGQGFEELMNNVYLTGVPFAANEMPLDLIRKGKLETAYFNFVYEPLYDAQGLVSGIVAVAIEITEQVTARKQIEASQKRLSNILSQSLMPIAIFKGPEMIVEFANEPMLTGMGKGIEILNKPLVEGVPELKDQVFPKLLAEVYATGVAYEAFETKAILVRNGIPIETYFNFVYQPYRDLDNSITGVTALATEVTLQVLAKKQIEASENQFRIFADSIQNLAWIADADGLINWYNQRWYDYTGKTLKEMEGSGWQQVHHPDEIKGVTEFLKESWKKNEAFELTFPLRRHDGEYHWFLTRAYPVKNNDGGIDKWIGTSTDITAQKTFTQKLEEKVKERTDDLLKKNLELELTNAELASFSYVASHDLKEPLRKIQMFTSRISEAENFSENSQKYFNGIIYSVERMQNLIDSLLNFSRADSVELKFTSCDLNSIVEESKSDLEISILERKAIIEYANLPTIIGMRIQLSQMFTNLIDNAIKYSNPETIPHVKITVESIHGNQISHASADPHQQYIAIKFTDNGIGFEEKYTTKIFEIFQRLHHKTDYSGTGIGLTIVKKVANNHKGFVIAESILGIGSTFTIFIPKE